MKVWSQKNLEDIRHEYIDFDGEWYLAFGRPEKSGCWIIYGKSGQGKSSFALQLARKFDEMGLRVLYLTLEMGACDDFVNSVLDVGISSKTNNIIYSDEATIKELQDYDVVMWEKHGVFAVDCDAMQAFDQIDVLNKSALIYIAAKNMGFEPDGMSQEQMKEMTVAFNLPK